MGGSKTESTVGNCHHQSAAKQSSHTCVPGQTVERSRTCEPKKASQDFILLFYFSRRPIPPRAPISCIYISSTCSFFLSPKLDGSFPRSPYLRGPRPLPLDVRSLSSLAPFSAHPLRSENWFTWDQDHPSFNETLVAGCASYQAFNRYLSGSDLFIVPRSRSELESVLFVNSPWCHPTSIDH